MENGDQYIANMRDGSVAGFRYFAFADIKAIEIEISGQASGRMLVANTPDFAEPTACLAVKVEGDRRSFRTPMRPISGTQPLYFRFDGTGSLNFHVFTLE